MNTLGLSSLYPVVHQDPIRNARTRSTQKLHIQFHQNPMRDQSNAIRDQVSFKQREQHIRDAWDFLCSHYHLNKSDLVKFLIKKEECLLKSPETIPFGFMREWL